MTSDKVPGYFYFSVGGGLDSSYNTEGEDS